MSVLTQGYWPNQVGRHFDLCLLIRVFQVVAKCNLPQNVLESAEVFRQWYLTRHNGRRLTWQLNLVCTACRLRFLPPLTHCCRAPPT